MKAFIKNLLIIIATFTASVFSVNKISAQNSASATWSLTTNRNVVTSGDVSAVSVATGGSLQNITTNTNGLSSNAWATSYQTNRYYEYSITPSTGKDLTITTVSFDQAVSTGSWNVRVAYSTDNFTNSTTLSSQSGFTSTSFTSRSSTGQSISVPAGTTIKFRVSAYVTDATAFYRNKNFVISGTTSNSTNRYSVVNTGDWSSTSTWSYSLGGTSGAPVPTASDDVYIGANDSVYITAGSSAKSVSFLSSTTTRSSLTINNTNTLTVSTNIDISRPSTGVNALNVAAGTLNVGGNLTFSSGGTAVRHQITISTGSLIVAGNISASGASGSAQIYFTGAGLLQIGGTMFSTSQGSIIRSTSTVEYTGSAQNIQPFTYYNLTLSGSGLKTFTTVLTTNVSIINDMKVSTAVRVQLAAGVNHSARSLKLGGVGQAIGTYGGNNSTATGTFKNTSYFGSSSTSSTDGLLTTSALAALPVTLTNFSAKAGLNNTVNLAWATSTEIVNKGFRIERQSAIGNGKFENVGFVASKASEGGNSSVPLYYSFVDVAPASNATNYYRLAQVDLDGKTTYSDVKLVRIGGETVTMVYPNPSNGAVNISRTANNNKMNIQILDMSGRMVQQYSNVTDANFKLNINKAGMYNIKMIYPQTGEQTIQRIVVQK